MKTFIVLAPFVTKAAGTSFVDRKGREVALKINDRVEPPGEFSTPDAGQAERLLRAGVLATKPGGPPDPGPAVQPVQPVLHGGAEAPVDGAPAGPGPDPAPDPSGPPEGEGEGSPDLSLSEGEGEAGAVADPSGPADEPDGADSGDGAKPERRTSRRRRKRASAPA